MRTEKEILDMLVILRAFNGDSVFTVDKRGRHEMEIIALAWVLGEYPITHQSEDERAEP